jgi:membrane protein DedA with SNARE-associated domain
MITHLLTLITNLIIHIISALSYGGIILLMALHSSIFIVPSEVVMPFSGFLVSSGRFFFVVVVISGTIGNLIGASFIYFLSYKGGRNLILKYEHIVLVSQADLEKVEKFFKRFGVWAILIGRCIPIVAGLISIPAGLSKIKYWKFLLLTFFGALIWNSLLTFIGLKLGENWLVLKDKLHNFDLIIIILILVGVIWWVYRHLISKKS